MKIQKILSILFVGTLLFSSLATKVLASTFDSSISMNAVSSQCQFSNTNVNISGSAIAGTPPGQISQYHVQILWGDGHQDDVTEVSSFGDEDPSTRDYSGSHVYTTPGTYTVKARVYHQNPNGNDNQADALASATVCIVSPLTISKTANTSFTRTWTWSLDKTADQTNLLLSGGQSFPVNYSVAATKQTIDSGWSVTGNISVTNPVGNPSITVDVTDTLATDGSVTVNCPTNTIAAGETLVCTYSKSLPAANNQLNTANVTVTDMSLLNGSATADVSFATATINKVDDCVTVTDISPSGPHDEILCNDGYTWNYSLTFGKDAGAQVPLICGINAYTNTASFVTDDTQTTGNDSVTVNATVACPLGCTLTQGYWKTHNASFKGGAPLDDTWDLVMSQKEQTPFYTSGLTWFNLFWTAPSGGNVYTQLAHQYMAAKLNKLNGADVPASVASALSGSDGFFSGKTLLTPLTNSQKNSAKGWAATLGSYNEGLIGPGHCSE